MKGDRKDLAHQLAPNKTKMTPKALCGPKGVTRSGRGFSRENAYINQRPRRRRRRRRRGRRHQQGAAAQRRDEEQQQQKTKQQQQQHQRGDGSTDIFYMFVCSRSIQPAKQNLLNIWDEPETSIELDLLCTLFSFFMLLKNIISPACLKLPIMLLLLQKKANYYCTQQ